MNDKETHPAVERIGYKIPPYRLACISKIAAKIAGILTDTSPIMLTADEAGVAMDMVKMLIERGRSDCN